MQRKGNSLKLQHQGKRCSEQIGFEATNKAIDALAAKDTVTINDLVSITLPSDRKFKETEDGRYLIELKGIIRFKIIKELKSVKQYRQCNVDFKDFELPQRPQLISIFPDHKNVISRLTRK